jgi:hypothetical protein
MDNTFLKNYFYVQKGKSLKIDFIWLNLQKYSLLMYLQHSAIWLLYWVRFFCVDDLSISDPINHQRKRIGSGLLTKNVMIFLIVLV